MKTRAANIGLVLLTILVIARFVDLRSRYSFKDGLVGNILSIDYNLISDRVQGNFSHSNFAILSTNSSLKKAIDNSNEQSTNVIFSPKMVVTNSESLISMEQRNSLVVYDPRNPILAEIGQKFHDPYDDAAPLDNGNTIVSELQSFMPRR